MKVLTHSISRLTSEEEEEKEKEVVVEAFFFCRHPFSRTLFLLYERISVSGRFLLPTWLGRRVPQASHFRRLCLLNKVQLEHCHSFLVVFKGEFEKGDDDDDDDDDEDVDIDVGLVEGMSSVAWLLLECCLEDNLGDSIVSTTTTSSSSSSSSSSIAESSLEEG